MTVPMSYVFPQKAIAHAQKFRFNPPDRLGVYLGIVLSRLGEILATDAEISSRKDRSRII